MKTDEYIVFENKYFKGAAKVNYIDPNTESILMPPFALVMIADSQTLSFIQSHPISDSDCTLLLSEEPNPEFLPINEDLEIEQVQDSITTFTSFIKSDSEYQGIGRIKEALECAAASYMSDLLSIPSISSVSLNPIQSTESNPAPLIATPNPVHSNPSSIPTAAILPSSSDDLDTDMQCFEYFLNKIKESCEKSKEVDDETRRKNAEATIMELAKYLSLDDEFENEADE